MPAGTQAGRVLHPNAYGYLIISYDPSLYFGGVLPIYTTHLEARVRAMPVLAESHAMDGFIVPTKMVSKFMHHRDFHLMLKLALGCADGF
jgi:hypothetical protein